MPFLDGTARDDVVARLARSAGLPAPLSDLLGLAVRLEDGSGPPVDLLLSTTGRGALTRMVPVLRRNAASACCSIMAYRSAAGPIARFRATAYAAAQRARDGSRPAAGTAD